MNTTLRLWLCPRNALFLSTAYQQRDIAPAKTKGDKVLVSIVSCSGLIMALGSGVTIANISDYYHHNDSNFQALSDHEPEPVFAHSSRKVRARPGQEMSESGPVLAASQYHTCPTSMYEDCLDFPNPENNQALDDPISDTASSSGIRNKISSQCQCR